MSRTHEEVLNSATVPTAIASSLAQFAGGDPTSTGFGSLLRAFVPRLRSRTGLASSATHKETLPGRIHGVVDAAGTANKTIIYAGVAGAGQVLVRYNVSGTEPGVATLTFGDGANTGYFVEKTELPAGFDELLATVAD